jgi:hypothetical protein
MNPIFSDFVEEVVQCICGQFWDLRGKPKIAERPITYGYPNDNRLFRTGQATPAKIETIPMISNKITNPPVEQIRKIPKTINKQIHHGIAL